jgi:dTMP kinase
MTQWTELLLMMASRAQHTEEVILPALRDRKVVICDRYADCTLAYQGYGRGLDPDTIAALNRIATLGLSPDLTILLDIPVEEAMRRRGCASIFEDRIERENSDFHDRVRTGYLTLTQLDPDRFLLIDGTHPIARIEAQIGRCVVEKLKHVKRKT